MSLNPPLFNPQDTWFHRHCSGLLNALTLPYGIAAKARAGLYERGWLSQRRLSRPVISVGNLTVGGTGKTPVVMWLANLLRTKGKRVGILSRGYRRANESVRLLVSDGRNMLTSLEEAGDEPFLLARNCPEAVIAVGADRYQLGRWVLNQVPIDCFILDDGYQHLGLYRDVNLLLIDASDVDGLRTLLPAGKLREPLSAARRATAFGLTRANLSSDINEVLDPLQRVLGTPISPIHIQFHAGQLMHIPTLRTESITWAANKQALVFSGIGNASSFRTTVTTMGVDVLDEMIFPDHCPYAQSHIDDIRRRMRMAGAAMALTTEKDAVKLEPFLGVTDEIWMVRLDVEVTKGREYLERLVDRVVEGKQVSNG